MSYKKKQIHTSIFYKSGEQTKMRFNRKYIKSRARSSHLSVQFRIESSHHYIVFVVCPYTVHFARNIQQHSFRVVMDIQIMLSIRLLSSILYPDSSFAYVGWIAMFNFVYLYVCVWGGVQNLLGCREFRALLVMTLSVLPTRCSW